LADHPGGRGREKKVGVPQKRRENRRKTSLIRRGERNLSMGRMNGRSSADQRKGSFNGIVVLEMRGKERAG